MPHYRRCCAYKKHTQKVESERENNHALDDVPLLSVKVSITGITIT